MYVPAQRSLYYGVAIAIVVVSGVCCSEGEVVEIERRENGDLVRLTTQGGVCLERPCPPSTQTYILEEEQCWDDISMQDSKLLYS